VMQRPLVASDETTIRFTGAPRLNAEACATPGGCNGGAQRDPLPRCVVLQHTSCLRSVRFAVKFPALEIEPEADPLNASTLHRHRDILWP
jgi:hypothetical protein